ncbi:hypothetical protein E2C01_060781 [Portunus trituberculatus]|uniref:Uncharacterized protein n=1 Tax=Portunus trituberculatus TaxID=210409 RepID=A0A5B7H255_PORTR|nr:hypothetical protein [Portunus trituberculatus]
MRPLPGTNLLLPALPTQGANAPHVFLQRFPARHSRLTRIDVLDLRNHTASLLSHVFSISRGGTYSVTLSPGDGKTTRSSLQNVGSSEVPAAILWASNIVSSMQDLHAALTPLGRLPARYLASSTDLRMLSSSLSVPRR